MVAGVQLDGHKLVGTTTYFMSVRTVDTVSR